MNVTLVDNDRLHIHQRSAIKFGPEDDCGAFAEDLAFPPLAHPTIYSLELTPSCNNRCPGCSNVFLADKETRLMTPIRLPMPVEAWRVILDKIAPHAQTLKLTGGEATSHPQFEQIVEMVEDMGVPFTLFTNGRWKSPAQVIALLQKSSQCAGLLISLHGADAEAHDAFTGIQGSFEETIQNIRLATQAGLTVHTNTVFTRMNYRQIEEIVGLSQSLGADCAVFNRYVGQPVANLALSPLALMQAIREVDRIGNQKDNTKLGTCIPLCFVESSSKGCLAGTAYCTIDPWGNLRPCNHAPQIAGNLLHQSLHTIWHSATMEAWRHLIPDECTTCSAFSTCHGGCRADAALKGLKQDPLMTIPLQVATSMPPQPKPKALTLYELAIPHLEYQLQEEFFGAILVKGSDMIPISQRAQPILDMMKHPFTLRDYQSTFGHEAVDFIGQLYEKGAVGLTSQHLSHSGVM